MRRGQESEWRTALVSTNDTKFHEISYHLQMSDFIRIYHHSWSNIYR
jgi:hypothetical protein